MHILSKISCIFITITTLFAQAHDTINKAGSAEHNPWVYNVPKAFENIPVRTSVYLGVWNNNIIEPPRYTQTLVNRYQGIWGGLNHFESIKRLPEHLGLGNYIVCTGTDPHTPESQLFIAQLGSEPSQGLFTKNLVKKAPPARDKLIKKISLSSEFWYAGSVDMAGSYLAVPVYNDTGSEILFYKISKSQKQEPTLQDLSIEKLSISIDRPGKQAPAVAFTRLGDGYYLLAVWAPSQQGKTRGLDFYCSREPNITHGFNTEEMVHVPTHLFCNYHGKNNYHNINFVNDYNGKLYLIGLENNSTTYPLQAGIDYADLFEIKIRTVTQEMIEEAKAYDFYNITANLPVGTKRPYVMFMTSKHMFCKQGICNFNAGATIYIPNQQHIFLYCLPDRLVDHGKQLTFAQYGSFEKTYPA